MVQEFNKVETGKAAGPSDVSLELTADSRDVGIQMMA